ncbi:MAG: hypothetical protein Q8Q65_04510 [bacterium]|nr:hypothetical protein [bacterium]
MKNYTRQNGQALIELVLVTGMLALILVTLVSLSVASLATVQKSRLRTRATTIAQQGLENIRSKRDQLNWVDFTTGCSSSQAGNWAAMVSDGNPYSSDAVCVMTGTVANIEVTVAWAFGGKSDSVILEMALSQPGEAIYR